MPTIKQGVKYGTGTRPASGGRTRTYSLGGCCPGGTRLHPGAGRAKRGPGRRGGALVEQGDATDNSEPRDWVVLLQIPLTLAAVGYMYTSYETRRAEAVERVSSEEDRIGSFLDEIGKLIFERNLRDSQRGDDVRRVARTRTLTVLLNMSPERKRRPLKAV